MASPISPTQAGFQSSVGTRRKLNNALPSLPASAFSVSAPAAPVAKDPKTIIDAFFGGNGVKGEEIDITFEKFEISGSSLASTATKKANLYTSFASKDLSEGRFAENLKIARENSSTVDIAIVGDVTEDIQLWESLETLMANSTSGAPIILCAFNLSFGHSPILI